MRNKKIILTLVALAMIVSVCVFAFAGCQDKTTKYATLTEALSPYLENNKPVTVKNVELTGLKGYTIQSKDGEMVVAYKDEETERKYMLFNAAKNESIATSTTYIRKVNSLSGAYYIEDTEKKTTKFFGKDGLLTEVDSDSCTASSGRFSDGRYLAEVDDKVVIATPSIEIDRFMFSKLTECGDLFVGIKGSIIYVFDSNKDFKYYFDVLPIVGYSEDYTATLLSKGCVAIQINVELTEAEAIKSGYSFIDGGKYYALSTYVYDLSAKTTAKVDFDGIIVGGSDTFKAVNSTALPVQRINADKRLQDANIEILDNKLNKIVDLDAYLPGAQYFVAISATEFLLTDGVTLNYFKDNALVKSYKVASINPFSNLLVAGNEYYNLTGTKVFTLGKDMTPVNLGATDGIVYYAKVTDEKTTFHAYNAKTNTTTNFDGYADKINDNQNVFQVYKDIDGVETVTAAYSTYTGQAIFTGKAYVSVTALTYGGEYTYISARDAQGEVSYYLSYVEK